MPNFFCILKSCSMIEINYRPNYNDCLYYTAIFPVKYDYLDCYVGKNNKVYPLSVKNTLIPNLDIITSTTDLAASEVELASIKNREERLKSILNKLIG